MVEVKPFSRKLVDIYVTILHMLEVGLQGAEDDFKVKDGSLRIEVISFDVRQKHLMVGWRQFVCEYFCDGYALMSYGLPDLRLDRLETVLQWG